MVSQQKIRVLIVDDISETRTIVKNLLRNNSDIEVVGEAREGEQGFNLALALKPDIVLMDINLPGLDGISATEKITRYMPSVQTIMISVQAGADYIRRAILAGAVDFLVKPFSYDELLAAIYRAHKLTGERLYLEIEETLLRVKENIERLSLYQHDFIKGCLADRLSSLAAGIAHDLRSPLNIILGILDAQDVGDDETLRKYLERIRRRVLYSKWMVDNFLAIGFSEKVTLSRIRLVEVIAESLKILWSKLSPSVHVSVQVPNDLFVIGDFNLLRLALMNIIDNAIEAMPDRGHLDIFAQDGPHDVYIVVTDTGTGINLENESKLFDIGFTTKPAHCGLGLHVARRVMRQMFGDIVYVRRNRKHGTEFRIRIPTEPALAKDPSELHQVLQNLEEQIGVVRRQSLSREQEEFVSSEFHRLTSVFASNLCNELNVIEATVEELQSRIAKDEVLNYALTKIAKNCAYSRLLARNIAEIGKRAELNYELVSLAGVIEDVLRLLERKMPTDKYRVEWEIDPTLGDVEADAISLRQVFMNLIRNALDAMPDGGVLKFQLYRDGQEAVIVVRDTGKGIAPENISRLFTMGFTTKPKGYGLGLYSVKTIVARHKGTISVSSSLGKGTSFTIRLPVVQSKGPTCE